MLSIELLEKRISDLEHAVIPQDVFSTTVQHGKIDTLYWVRNGGELKTEQQINSKIQRIEEEMILLQPDDMWYQEKQARIYELKYVRDTEIN